MPAPGIADGAIVTRFGLLLGLLAARRRLGAGFRFAVRGCIECCVSAAAAASARALAVVLRVLCRFVTAAVETIAFLFACMPFAADMLRLS